MAAVADACLRLLRAAGVEVAPGLSADELRAVEARFGFAFADDHRELLMAALPVGARWVDWRGGADDELAARLAAPLDGVLFDVELGGFWPGSWGPRPIGDAEALATARRRLADWPRLVPIYGHRYLAAAPSPAGAPVFSVVQTDVIIYGADLLDYLRREFAPHQRGEQPMPEQPVTVEVGPWSRLAMGDGDVEL